MCKFKVLKFRIKFRVFDLGFTRLYGLGFIRFYVSN